jgi:uncharacterized membrane protein
VLFIPVIWGLSPRHLAPLVAALPTMAMNSLSVHPLNDLTNPFGQYSLMVVPFLAVAIVAAVANKRSLLQRPRWIVAWSIGLVLLGAGARSYQVSHRKAADVGNNLAARQALSQIECKGGVLTTHEIAPHVSQRPLVQYIDPARPLQPLEHFKYVLLNLAHASAQTHDDLTDRILSTLHGHPDFVLAFQQEEVYLFRKERATKPPEAAPLHADDHADVN